MSEARHQYATYHDLAGKRVLVTGKISCMLLLLCLPPLSGLPAPALHLLMSCMIQAIDSWPCMPVSNLDVLCMVHWDVCHHLRPQQLSADVGATGGIGKAIALAFATQGQLDICLWSRSRDKLEAVARQVEQLGSRPHIVTGDLTKGEDCRRGVAETVSQALSLSTW